LTALPYPLYVPVLSPENTVVGRFQPAQAATINVERGRAEQAPLEHGLVDELVLLPGLDEEGALLADVGDHAPRHKRLRVLQRLDEVGDGYEGARAAYARAAVH